jgi:hypothetical protein
MYGAVQLNFEIGITMKTIITVLVTLVGLTLAGCGTANRVEAPMFTGNPSIAHLRGDMAGLDALGTPPKPNFKTLRLSIRDEQKDLNIGGQEVTLDSSTPKFGEATEKIIYKAFGGKCTVLRDQQSVQVAGLIQLMYSGSIRSNDCNGWGAGFDRRELVQVREPQGSLFPMQVGNKASLTLVTLVSKAKSDTGLSETEDVANVTFEVVQRIPDFWVESAGKSLGEVFVIRRKDSIGQSDLLFSTQLGWQIGYKNGLSVSVVDWTQ